MKAYKRQEGSNIILRRGNPFIQIVVPDHKESEKWPKMKLIEPYRRGKGPQKEGRSLFFGHNHREQIFCEGILI